MKGVCRECDGRGYRLCPSCDYGAEYDHDKQYQRNCFICNGTAQLQCESCFGTGEDDDSGEVEEVSDA